MSTAIGFITPVFPPRRRRPARWVWLLYCRAIIYEFRFTLLVSIALIASGALLYAITPQEQLAGRAPSILTSFYGAWMAMLAQPIFSPPNTWYLTLMCGLYPLLGLLLIGEGIVRFALLMISKRHGEKEWMRVMASTYRDHVILGGLGHLGHRVLEQLTASGIPVVVLERDDDAKSLAAARSLGVPVLIRDMKEDQALLDANIYEARAIILATNDDMANLEVALDARRLNPRIRVVLRLFDQQIAEKITGALAIDVAFSSAALAAPIVAALSLETKVLSSNVIAGIPHVTSEIVVDIRSPLANRRLDELETGYNMRVLARTTRGMPTQVFPGPATTIAAGDTLVIHTAASQLATLAAAARGLLSA